LTLHGLINGRCPYLRPYLPYLPKAGSRWLQAGGSVDMSRAQFGPPQSGALFEHGHMTLTGPALSISKLAKLLKIFPRFPPFGRNLARSPRAA